MSNRARHRRDKRAEAMVILADDPEEPGDEPDTLTTQTGEMIDLRAPWRFPSTDEERTRTQ